MPSVLIIDDDILNRELLQTVFERSGFQVLIAANGRTALDVAAAAQPDVIVCDVRLGTMSGYEVCAALKADPATSAIPVIFQTAYEDEAQRQEGIRAGAADFVPKMLGWQVLLERVKALIP
jgi:putative two-component system response regulator